MKNCVFTLSTACLILAAGDWKAYGTDYSYALSDVYTGSHITEKRGVIAQ